MVIYYERDLGTNEIIKNEIITDYKGCFNSNGIWGYTREIEKILIEQTWVNTDTYKIGYSKDIDDVVQIHLRKDKLVKIKENVSKRKR